MLPQAIATGYIHIGTIAGKLNGVMPAQTPSGWRSEWVSIDGPTWRENSPFRSCGMPQQNSTTSMPRWTSPTASSWTLPCSAEMALAIRSMFRSRRSLKRKKKRARFSGGMSAQAGSASFAAATAASSSAAVESGRIADCSPVAGLNTGALRGLVDGASLPPITLVIVCIVPPLLSATEFRSAYSVPGANEIDIPVRPGSTSPSPSFRRKPEFIANGAARARCRLGDGPRLSPG